MEDGKQELGVEIGSRHQFCVPLHLKKRFRMIAHKARDKVMAKDEKKAGKTIVETGVNEKHDRTKRKLVHITSSKGINNQLSRSRSLTIRWHSLTFGRCQLDMEL